MEKIYTAKSLDQAKQLAITEFTAIGIDETEIEYEILEQPVKKLFGLKGEYKILAKAQTEEDEVSLTSVTENTSNEPLPEAVSAPAVRSEAKEALAIAYLSKVLDALGVKDFQINPSYKDDILVLDITGEKLGVIIGRRGETLDSLQYLTILASNRGDEPYSRLSVDCNGYREKRRETLEALAVRTAQKVLKQGRRAVLEPMNPYERRIIHSKITEIEGVTSHSQGEEPFRKVVISAVNPKGKDKKSDSRGNRREKKTKSGEIQYNSYKKSDGFSTSFEREYKRTPVEPIEYSQETVDTEKNASLYGKIEL